MQTQPSTQLPLLPAETHSEQHGLRAVKASQQAGLAHSNAAGSWEGGHDFQGNLGHKDSFPCRSETRNTLWTRANSKLSALKGCQYLSWYAMLKCPVFPFRVNFRMSSFIVLSSSTGKPLAPNMHTGKALESTRSTSSCLANNFCRKQIHLLASYKSLPHLHE